MFGGGHDDAVFKIIQDGDKRRMLCFDCEQRLSPWEKRFREDFLEPLHRRPTPVALPISYGPWAAKFGASVLWRILFAAVEEHPEAVNPRLATDIRKALRQWKAFLRDEARSPKQFEVHLLALAFGRRTRDSEQYLRGAIEWDTIFHEPTDQSYLIIKIGILLLVGVIRNPRPAAWRNTKLHVEGGAWGQGKFIAPPSIAAFVRQRVNATSTVINRKPNRA